MKWQWIICSMMTNSLVSPEWISLRKYTVHFCMIDHLIFALPKRWDDRFKMIVTRTKKFARNITTLRFFWQKNTSDFFCASKFWWLSDEFLISRRFENNFTLGETRREIVFIHHSLPLSERLTLRCMSPVTIREFALFFSLSSDWTNWTFRMWECSVGLHRYNTLIWLQLTTLVNRL